MEEVYDIHQYTHLVILYLQKTTISINYYSTIRRNFCLSSGLKTNDACIAYDKQKKNVKSWGDKCFESDVEDDDDDVFIDGFRDELYKVFKKDKDNWNRDDKFLLKAVSDFIRRSVKELVKESKGEIKGIGVLHYIFVVPSEWEEEIKETLIRPILIQSNLISNNNDNDRLLFCSDLETIFYDLMKKNKSDFDYRRKTILSRLVPISDSEILIKLDLVSTVNPLFNFSGSLVYPKVERSNQLLVTINTFTDGIRAFIKNKIPTNIQEKIVQIIMSTSSKPVRDKDFDLMKPLITDISKWELDKCEEDVVGSICIFDICSLVCENMTNNIDDLLLNDMIKIYDIYVRLDSLSFGINPDENLLNWSKYLLAYNRIYSRNKNIIFTDSSSCKKLLSSEIVKGAFQYGLDVINNADIYSRPRIVSVENTPVSSSIFQDSKPNAIMNIEISIESTTLSYSLLDENGFTKDVWNHSDFLNNKSLHSLGHFFSFSETTMLNVKFSFIEFAKDYLVDYVLVLSSKENSVLLKLNAAEIEAMLCQDSHSVDLLVSTQQPIYIKAFVLLYMIYIKDIISSKLLDIVDPDMKIKIGYSITIEKILLNRLFSGKGGLKDIVYASGLIQRDDDSKKLRIITQGERILHLLRRSLNLTFLLKSFFLLAQLHESYIQLTLNQVVTESSSNEEDQEAIIISDIIIDIPNVYTSLCLNMWNNIVEDNSLIQLCDIHREYSGNNLLELFSLKNQMEFSKNLTQYISKDNLDNNSSQLATDKIIIQLSTSCNCRVYLTVHDVINISFQPVLQDIASLVSASIINNELFGKFWNLQYLFHLIYFDYNTQLHDSLIKMLKETTEDVKIVHGVSIPQYIIPKSLNQIFHPAIYQRPVSYKEFQVGRLHLVYGDRYGFGFRQFRSHVRLIYKNKTTYTKTISVNEETVFPLFKVGDIIHDLPKSVMFYLNPQEKPYKIKLRIKYFKLKTSSDLIPDGTARFDDIQENIFGPFFDGLPNGLQRGQDIPIVISILYEAYSGSLNLIAKLVGQDINIIEPTRLGTPMHLSRF